VVNGALDMKETNYLDGMDKKFLISVGLTTGVFMLTVVLFVVVVIDLNVPSSDPKSTAVISNVPQHEELDHPGQKIFKANCTPCHRIRQKLIGPALAGVLDRRDSLWVIKMIRNSSQLIASGDPTAIALFREYNSTQMTSFTSFSDEELKSLLEYLKLESAREEKPLPAPSESEV
jgi:mono/diheme cytochrome c family protein